MPCPHWLQLEEEEKAYAEAVASGPAITSGSEVDLGMRVILVHGDTTIADSADGGLNAATAKFKDWVRKEYFATA